MPFVMSARTPRRISAPDPELRISLRTARTAQCRYIECEVAGDTIICGAPTITIGNNSSWCAWHRRIVFKQS